MFYISSRGHSATGWLAHQISQHQKIVCWHGTRSIPPANPGINDMSPKKFVEGLLICEKQRDKRIYGAIHGFHGTQIKNDIESKGGKFAGLFRDPISKISSFFHAYLWSRISNGILVEDFEGPTKQILEKLSNEKISSIFEKKKSQVNSDNLRKIISFIENKFKKNIRKIDFGNRNNHKIVEEILNKDNSTIIAELFFSICEQSFIYDNEIFQNCEDEQLFVMENLVSDKDYFVDKVWNYLIPNLRDQANLNGFNQKFKHHNPNTSLSAMQKLEYLPHAFQELLSWFFQKQDQKLINFYKSNKYLIV